MGKVAKNTVSKTYTMEALIYFHDLEQGRKVSKGDKFEVSTRERANQLIGAKVCKLISAQTNEGRDSESNKERSE